MKISSYIAIGLVIVSPVFGAGSASAQSLSDDVVPAEFPPASFSGRQYVDSNGCVFVRAGIDGNVTWVPRVAQDRTVICGFQPSLARATPEPAPATPTPTRSAAAAPAAAAAAPAARSTTATAQPSRSTEAQAQTQTQAQRSTIAQPQAVRVAVQPATPAPQPTTVRVVTATPTTATVARPTELAPRQSACRGASEISSRYLATSSGLNVRCGPQASAHVTVVSGGADGRRTVTVVQAAPVPTATAVQDSTVQTQAAPLPRSAATTAITRQTRVVPRTVYETQVASTRGVFVPEGYEPVWSDDRLNPKRAHMTVGGIADTQIAWTNTVPRLLVLRETGQEVTYLYPGLMYPYTSYAEQRAATISTRGTAPQAQNMRGRHNRDGAATRVASGERAGATGQIAGASASSATVSTRSATVMPQAPSHRFVQVGYFASKADASSVAQRLARLGLPSRFARTTRGGTAYSVVLAGPFSSQRQLATALSKVRGMGYGGATLRR